MSRRKQANPRSLKDQEENHVAKGSGETCYTVVPSYEDLNNQESDQDLVDYDDYAPLVVDTSRATEDSLDQDDMIRPSQSVTEADVTKPADIPFQSNPHFTFAPPSHQQQDQVSNSSSDHDQLFIDSGTPSLKSEPSSRTPSISSLSDQLSPGGLSSNISSSKVHRRGKKNQSNPTRKEPENCVDSDDSDSKILPITNGENGDSKYICPICKAILSSSHELTKHIRSHNSQTQTSQANTCTICGKVLSSQSSLDRHMLVHSGERPFVCKVCKMSFTTNGNMHRHSRIHIKENELNGLIPNKPIRPKPKLYTWKPRMKIIPNTDTTSALSLHLNSPLLTPELVPKTFSYIESKPLPNAQLSSPPMKRTYNFVDYSAKSGSPIKKPNLMQSAGPPSVPSPTSPPTPPTSITIKNPTTTSSVPQFKPIKVPPQQESKPISTLQIQTPQPIAAKKRVIQEPSSGEEKEGDQLHCPVCNKAFLCKYGLATHLETHPEVSMKCATCHMTFPTPRALNMHKLMLHSKEKPAEEIENRSETKSTPPAVIGFYDLGFMDFSVKKFPLVAKSWCEENVRVSSSAYHNFVCKECSKAFPSKAALQLHIHTHSPEKTSQCPLCECDFLDTTELHLHMVKHLSDKAFNDVMIKSKPKEDKSLLLKSPKADKIGKHDFLASFGLTTVSEAELLERRDKESKSDSNFNMDKKENNDYYAKLGQIFSPDVAPVNPLIASKFAQLSPEEQAKMYLEFQKLVQAQITGEIVKGYPSLFPGAEQMKAFLPYLFPMGLSKSGPNSPVSISQLTTLAAMTNPAMLSTLMGNTNMSSPLPTPPPSSESGSGSSGEMGDKYPSKNGVFQCKYCDLVFTNYRTMKGHTRTHLGLSPYKCNLCSYSSADKSTLIRHLRTHNGERPFQCRVCDFAFTTKANCERHVRKKHGKYLKEDVEGAIGYNKYVAESTNTTENFQSPDTVCKYCGEDFKFFRALKHHLRSHSSCPQKPFLCMRCDIGFSTKANCVRHLQKQHPEVSQYQIEQYIHVNEPSMDDGEKSFGEGLSDDSQLESISTSEAMTNGAPPTAHSTPTRPPDSLPQSPVTVKQEPMDTEDGPLDFSVKSGSNTPTPDVKPKLEELPIDLSVKKKEDSPPPKQTTGSGLVTYDTNLFQCQFCPMGFSSQRVLERHLWQQHPQLLEIMEKQISSSIPERQTTDQPPKGNNLKMPLNFVSQVSEDRMKIIMRFPKTGSNPRSLKDRIMKQDSKTLNNHGVDSMSDLASIKKMLDAAKAQQSFTSFLIDTSNMSGKSGEDSMDCSLDGDKDVSSTSNKDNTMDDPPVLSPGSKGDNSSTADDREMPEIAQSPEQFAQMFREGSFSLPKIPKTVNDPTDKLLVKKKRNSYADSPHKLQCPYCTRTFPWVSSLTRHLLTHTGQKPFKCPRCPVTFSTKSNRERHLIRKHGVNMMDPLSRQTMDRPYKCHLCVFSSFSTQGNLLKHYKERHAGCELPDTLADLDKAVTKGLSTTIPPHERGMYDFNSIESYNMDMQLNKQDEQRMDTSKDMEEGNAYQIPEDMKSDDDDEDDIIPLSMDDSINEQSVISNHVPEFTGSAERQINPERDNYNVDKITSCWKCSEKFVSRKLLVRHLKEHNIDLPFKCYLCDASYESRKSCLDHQESVHASDWKILKEKNKVDSVESFAKHMDKVVENNCNKVDQGTVLEIPGQNADDPKMEVVSADYMQRKVYCSLCPKRFWSLQDLRRHMRSHTGERPFECDICQKRFTLKHSMMRHRKKHLDSGSLSPSDDEDNNNLHDDSAGISKGFTHHRPILPRMTPIPVIPVPVMSTAVNLNTSINKDKINMENRPHFITVSSTPVATPSTKTSVTVENDSKDNSADILHNLLGVDVGSIDKMLDSADSAAKLLGM